MARRRSKARSGFRGRGGQTRSATKRHTQRSKRTTVYEEVYEGEW